jgi:hypothetical protein
MLSFEYKYYRNGVELVTNSYLVARRSDCGYFLVLNEDDGYYFKLKTYGKNS